MSHLISDPLTKWIPRDVYQALSTTKEEHILDSNCHKFHIF